MKKSGLADSPLFKKPQPINKTEAASPAVLSKHKHTLTSKKANNIANKQVSNTASKHACNIAILQFDESDIKQLREVAYSNQSYRLTRQEVEWIKDTAYRLSKEMERGKVSQVDIIRVAIKLFEIVLSEHKANLLKILIRMK